MQDLKIIRADVVGRKNSALTACAMRKGCACQRSDAFRWIIRVGIIPIVCVPICTTDQPGCACEPGPAGPQGPAGGVLNYADFYALMPGDNSATVAPGTDVSFPQDGPNSGSVLPVPALMLLRWRTLVSTRCCSR